MHARTPCAMYCLHPYASIQLPGRRAGLGGVRGAGGHGGERLHRPRHGHHGREALPTGGVSACLRACVGSGSIRPYTFTLLLIV